MNLETARRVLSVPPEAGLVVIGRLYAEKRSDLAARWASAAAPEAKAEYGQKLAEVDEAFAVASRAAARPREPDDEMQGRKPSSRRESGSPPPPSPMDSDEHAPAADTGGRPWMVAIGVTALASTIVVNLVYDDRLKSLLWSSNDTASQAMKVVKADAATRAAEARTETPRPETSRVRAARPQDAQGDAPRMAGPRPGSHFKNSIGMEMVWVAPLKFWVGKYEVTQAEYEALMGRESNQSHFKGARRPVERVSWNGAVEFIDRLNQNEKSTLPERFTYRLPLDAEYDVYVGDASLSDAVTHKRLGDGTSPVGSLGPNNFGLHDTRGNVWEWMSDWYSKTIHWKDSHPLKDSDWAGERSKVLRGGAWDVSDQGQLALASRSDLGPDLRGYSRGFRVVLGPPPR